ncbi:tryptophan-rich sensory protein [Microvirga sp. ACRRW]|uniref:TspO/MBR family protein n=1 Tax=Microvirga sp. ACRRW TaxID=2918205 RepID=UPI001EF5CB4A|nr:TspO/MBR family protein [Microvirga sp. ACRRW]MCG7393585.1 tryptophan-rich sensory protein [Microvirga sp. ACRRW]
MPTDQTVTGSHATPPLLRLLIAVVPVVAVSFAGSLVTRAKIPTWYAGLAKPGFSPPNWLFAPVWTTLYAMMAYALWRILSLPRSMPGRTGAVVLFFVQLALNSAWSFAFFGAQSPLLGLVVIAALIVAILATILAFWKLDRIAALLLAPYLAWVCFATLLNGSIWQLNG